VDGALFEISTKKKKKKSYCEAEMKPKMQAIC